MSYRAVLWNAQKKTYDKILLAGVLGYLILFAVLNSVVHPNAPIETTLMRAFGSGALVLLHIILCIGPLCRLDKRFLPLLYNRRHMGVTMFFLALFHAVLVVLQYHAFSDINPIVSIFVANQDLIPLNDFPFQPLGFFALAILFLMAATSHDFWLHNLTAPVWKSLHMLVYVAYVLLLGHVAFGILQAETHPANAIWMGLGLVTVTGLHLLTGFRELELDKPRVAASGEWVELCSPDEIKEKRARIFCVSNERIAVFKYDGKVSAVSNVCQHQNGPLGEGKIVDGCITCPWHAYQYKPADGASPPPYTEKLPTFNIKLENGSIWVDPQPNPPGTHVEPVVIAQ